jgi:hypothetical protein
MKSIEEMLEELDPFLNCAQRAIIELNKTPIMRLEPRSDEHDHIEPEICSDLVEQSLLALQEALHLVKKQAEARKV